MPVFTHLQGNRRQGSSLRFVSESVFPVACWFCSDTFPVPVWLQLYRNLFCSPCLGGFQVPCPGFFAFLCLRVFSQRESLDFTVFHLQPICCQCPNSLFSISFIGKALHGSYIDVWQNLVCFCVPGQPPHASLSWELQGLNFFWTLTLSLSPREERSIQSKAGRVIWSLCLVQLPYNWPASSKLRENYCHGTSLLICCYILLFSNQMIILTAGEGVD